MTLTNAQQAQRAFATAEAALKELEWNYELDDEEDFFIHTGVQGGDLPIPMRIRVREHDLVAAVLSPIELEISEENVGTLLMALCLINDALVVGNFDFHESNRTVWFRISTLFRDSELSTAAIKYLLYATVTCVDEYNDKLLLLMNGLMTLEEFSELLNKE